MSPEGFIESLQELPMYKHQEQYWYFDGDFDNNADDENDNDDDDDDDDNGNIFGKEAKLLWLHHQYKSSLRG